MFRTISVFAVVLSLAVSAAAQPQAPEPEGRYFVEFEALGPNAANAIRAAGGTTVHEFPAYNVIAARLPAAAVQALRNNPRVRSITEDVPRYPFAQSVPYGISMVQAYQLTAGQSLGDVTVCVIDSGYNVGHPDLPVTGVAGTNNSGTGNWDQDRCGHGTHVAGTISAMNNERGVVGVLPDGELPMHIVKVFGDTCAWTYSSDLINALNSCRNAGAKVVSMSLGGGKPIGPWEERAFDDAYNAGVLSIAAAGNAGDTSLSYPASYNSVVSVGAIDSNKLVADFSQQNSQVELAAPGVAVLSTLPYIETNTLATGTSTYSGGHIEASARTEGVTGTLVDGGRCVTTGSWGGQVVLCERGDVSFKAKIDTVKAGGGVAAVIYNNVSGGFLGTCDDGTGTSCSLPGVSLSREDGVAALGSALTSSTVVSRITYDAEGYEAWDGTSMATPHVSGVAALVWSHNAAWTNVQIREALQQTAQDLGPAGRDNAYGYGLVQARASLCVLSPDNAACTSSQAITLSVQGYKVKGAQKADLTWSGATSASVDVFRDDVIITPTETENDGFYTDNLNVKGRGSYTYKVCEAGTATCSNSVTIVF